VSEHNYHIVYEQGPTSWGAYVEDLPGCFAVGDTYEECERLITEAIPLHLAALQRQQNTLRAQGQGVDTDRGQEMQRTSIA